MTRKTIYISWVHLTDKISRDWYVDYLIAKGVKVEYWDAVALVRGDYVEVGAKTTDYLHTFRTFGEIEVALRLPENENANYVMLVSYQGAAVRLFRLLSKYNCRMLYFAWGVFPEREIQSRLGFVSRFSDPLRLLRRVYYKAKETAFKKLKLVKPFDIVFAAGQAVIRQDFFANRVVPINLFDYDHYNKVKTETGRIVVGRYAVFLDVYLPYHSDLEFAGGKAVNPKTYYAALNRFFDLLEAKYQVKVVIAAHPKADYSDEPFRGREIYSLRTPELVKDADFVIAHHSASISYAVLNYKPILFAYTNEMAELCMETVVSYINGFARYLNAPVFNIDEITQGNQIVVGGVNHVCYEKYKYDFLTTHESEHETTQEIFWRELNFDTGSGDAVKRALV